jgi:F-type H+-transporting ATPase subunit delta
MASKIVISKIAEPYADALLELAKSNNCVDAITADVNDLLTFLTSVPLLATYFENPVISIDKKKELVNTVMGSKLNPYMLKFVLFLIDRRRIPFF